ncbi:MAG: DNA-processing protein DprA [Pseudomonadota bacterium]
MTNDDELFACLRLARSRGIGSVTHGQLLRRFGSAMDAVEQLPDFLAEKRATQRITLASDKDIEKELEGLARLGGVMLTRADEAYPKALAVIPDPPPVISVLGNTALLPRPAAAIVGARNASAAGQRMASYLATDLGDAGWIITSGLARGIDGAAHRAALSSGTIAVLAGGVNSIYPREHGDLYRAIVEQGAVVSEMRLGHTATARDFPKRNRIVSGLTRGVVVVEAAERSGTLITARLSLEQGREVCAVPGSPLDPRSAGTNRLIRQGAVLVRDAEDVITALGDPQDPPRGELFAFEEDPASPVESDKRESLETELKALLSPTPTHRDELLRASTATPAQFADIILDLILSGIAEELPGGMFALASDASRSDI